MRPYAVDGILHHVDGAGQTLQAGLSWGLRSQVSSILRRSSRSAGGDVARTACLGASSKATPAGYRDTASVQPHLTWHGTPGPAETGDCMRRGVCKDQLRVIWQDRAVTACCTACHQEQFPVRMLSHRYPWQTAASPGQCIRCRPGKVQQEVRSRMRQYREIDDVVVVHLHAQVLRLGLLHQAVLELAPLGVQRLALVVLHTHTSAQYCRSNSREIRPHMGSCTLLL